MWELKEEGKKELEGEEEEEGYTKMGMEGRDFGRCGRFLTDREQRKVNNSSGGPFCKV